MLGAMINVKLRDVVVVKIYNTHAITNALEDHKKNSLKMFDDGYSSEYNVESFSNSTLKTMGSYFYFITTPNTYHI